MKYMANVAEPLPQTINISIFQLFNISTFKSLEL